VYRGLDWAGNFKNGGANVTIEKLTENFVKAAGELIEATGAFNVQLGNSEKANAHMLEGCFYERFGDMTIAIRQRDSDEYPTEKSVTIGGIKFFCLSKDMDTWAKLKGYVKEAV